MTWETATLGSLGVEVQTGFASGKHAGDGDVLHLRPMNITSLGTLTLEGGKFVAADAGTQRVRHGDVLFNNTNSPKWVGKTAWVSAAEDLAFSNHMSRLRAPSERVDSKFMAIYLHHLQSSGYFEAICSNHVNQASISRKALLQTELPLPLLEEQRRIVAILEDHLSHLDAADTYLADGERRIRAWRAAAIDEVLWRGNPPMRPIQGLLREGMRNGRSDRAVKGQERGTRTLTLTAVTRNSFTDEFTKETVTPPSVADGLWLEPGDIFVQRANTPELVGTSARYEGDRKWAIFPDLLIRLRPDETRIRGEYLAAALRSERVHRQLRAKAKGLAGSMPKIDQRAVAETCVPCPDLESQVGAVIALNHVTGAASSLSRDVSAQRRRSATLRRSLLAAAFSGQLTGSSPGMSVVGGRIEA